jgi:hypothetical protein
LFSIATGNALMTFVAGAYLAKKAKAIIKHIDSGDEISYADLERALL